MSIIFTEYLKKWHITKYIRSPPCSGSSGSAKHQSALCAFVVFCSTTVFGLRKILRIFLIANQKPSYTIWNDACNFFHCDLLFIDFFNVYSHLKDAVQLLFCIQNSSYMKTLLSNYRSVKLLLWNKKELLD